MATELERQRLRLDLGFAATDTVSLSDFAIDTIFDEAAETYTTSMAQHTAARVIALDRLLIQAAHQVDYTQNNSSERASQRYAQLSQERAKWAGRLAIAVAAGRGSTVRSGRTTRRPARRKEYPGSWGW